MSASLGVQGMCTTLVTVWCWGKSRATRLALPRSAYSFQDQADRAGAWTLLLSCASTPLVSPTAKVSCDSRICPKIHLFALRFRVFREPRSQTRNIKHIMQNSGTIIKHVERRELPRHIKAKAESSPLKASAACLPLVKDFGQKLKLVTEDPLAP